MCVIPENMLEAILLVMKGVFTGASKCNKGIFRADKGTLLDEISEMPLSLQAKLLGYCKKEK